MSFKSLNLKKIFAWIVLTSLFVGTVFGAYAVLCFLKPRVVDLLLPLNVELEMKDLYSKKQRVVVENLFQNFTKQMVAGEFNPSLACQKIKQSSLLLKEVKFQTEASRSAKLEVFGIKPLFIVNDKLVLAEDEKLYGIEFFELYDLSSLKRISASTKYCGERISKDFYQFLKKVPSVVWDRYTITYQKPTLIKLRSLNDDYEIIVDEQKIFDLKKMREVDSVLKDVKSRKLIRIRRSLKNSNILSFDLRFKNRILVKQKSEIMGGG